MSLQVQMEDRVDHRGRMVRSDRQMSDEDTREYLRQHCVAHVEPLTPRGGPTSSR